MIEKFSKEVSDQLGYYVYRLIDPRDGQTFYVGKGKGNRVFAHIKNSLANYEGESYYAVSESDDGTCINNSDHLSDKVEIIKEIINQGLEVIHIIHRYGLDENTALEVEAALMDCFPGLSNEQKGIGADRGVTNAEVLENNLSYKEFDEDNDINYCVIKIKQSTIDECRSVYEAVRKSWRVNKSNIEKVDYVLAACDSAIKEVFKVNAWLQSDDEQVSDRYMFEGEVAENDVREIFISKKLPEYYRKAQYPVVYKKAT